MSRKESDGNASRIMSRAVITTFHHPPPRNEPFESGSGTHPLDTAHSNLFQWHSCVFHKGMGMPLKQICISDTVHITSVSDYSPDVRFCVRNQSSVVRF